MIFGRKDKVDYDELTNKLAERSAEVARLIRKKMIELDIPHDKNFEDGEIIFEDFNYRGKAIRIEKVEVCDNTIEYLAIKNYEYDDNDKKTYSWHSLEHVNQALQWEDYSDVKIIGANNEEAISFLHSASNIYNLLSRLKEDRAKEKAKKKKREINDIKETIKKTDWLLLNKC